LTGANSIYLVEDVFKQIAEAIPDLHGLSLSKIGHHGIELVKESEEAPATV
jgi:hypothetical protein